MARRPTDTRIPKWRPVVGYEGWYEVSNEGRIRRQMAGKGATAGRVLTVKVALNGYSRVALSRNDRKRRFGVHRLVAGAFIGPPPPGAIINHKNGVKLDNRPENLEWTDYSGNARHAFRSGIRKPTDVSGERNPRAKLTLQQVEEIRALKGVVGQRRLGQRYGVSKSAVQFIHQGKHWR